MLPESGTEKFMVSIPLSKVVWLFAIPYHEDAYVPSLTD